MDEAALTSAPPHPLSFHPPHPLTKHSSTSSFSDDSGCDSLRAEESDGVREGGSEAVMDISLTDMQWLQRMDAGAEIPGIAVAAASKRGRGKSGDKERQKGKDGCRKKLDYGARKDSNKPPLSYASMISLAICSAPQRMMTLSSIYRWIETTFPFYRTPEAKAWKNSIRHNLSIRKNMFMKVYQCPPRRGNGSYWTLLSDGEDELKRAVPLFSTLQPPIIDQTSIYNHMPSTHTVRSKGQYVPILPSTLAGATIHPFFSEVVQETHPLSDCVSVSTMTGFRGKSPVFSRPGRALSNKITYPPNRFDRAGGDSPCLSESDDSFCRDDERPSTPKRRRLSEISVHVPLRERDGNQPRLPATSRHIGTAASRHVGATTSRHDGAAGTLRPSVEPHQQDASLLDSSFLTPMKDIVPDVELDTISLSPLYNFVSPHTGGTPLSLASPFNFNPFRAANTSYSQPSVSTDSGVFSPLKVDGLRFSTPLKGFSPLTDLALPGTFGTPQNDIYLMPRFLESSSDGTPTRRGSLQPLSLLGFTPPSSSEAVP